MASSLVPVGPFENARIEDVPFENAVVALSSALPADLAIRELGKHRILSAPVHQDGAPDNYLGFFDMSDFVVYVINALREGSAPDGEEVDGDTLITKSIQDPSGVVTLVDMSKTNRFEPIAPDSLLIDALEKLGAHGLHRVPVVNPATNKIEKIISQSAMVRYLNDNPDLLSVLGDTTVASIDGIDKGVICIGSEMPALRAFELMIKHKISAVGIVDREDNDKLVAAISNSDLQAVVSAGSFRVYGISTLDFVAEVRQRERKTRASVVAISKNTHIRDVFSKLSKACVHRAFVVDEHHKAIGIVSLTDLLRHLHSRATKHAPKNW